MAIYYDDQKLSEAVVAWAELQITDEEFVEKAHKTGASIEIIEKEIDLSKVTTGIAERVLVKQKLVSYFAEYDKFSAMEEDFRERKLGWK